MNLSTTESAGVLIVHVHAKALDAGTARDFKSSVTRLLTPGSKVVFDLAKVDFVDSTGLGMLVSCLREAQASGGDIRLYGLTKPVRTLFEMVRMHKVFDIYSTADEVVQSYTAQTQKS
jgi:anti-sigma B factor antagonist